MTATEHPPAGDVVPVTLVPSSPAAFGWSLGAGVATAAGAWFLADRPSLFAVVFLAFAVASLGWFGIQLAAPTRFSLAFGHDELDVRLGWRRETIAWEEVRFARVVRIVGEQVLELHLQDAAGRIVRSTGLPLPVGTDVGRVHGFLLARLGLADPSQPLAD